MKFNYFLTNPFFQKRLLFLKRPVNWILFITLAFHALSTRLPVKKTRLSLISTVYEKRNSPYKLSRIIYKGVYRFIVIFL